MPCHPNQSSVWDVKMRDEAGMRRGGAADELADTAVLFGRLENVRPLVDALSCIYSAAHKSQDVVISAQASGGIRFAVEEPGCLLASVIIPGRAFAAFECRDAGVRIRLNLSLMLDCLNIFGGGGERDAAGVRISYGGVGHPLVLQLYDSDAVTLCELTTIDADAYDETDFQFLSHAIVNSAIVGSEALRDAISELDYAGSTTAELRLAPRRPRFRFQSPASTTAAADDDGGDDDDAQCTVELPDPTDRSSDTFQTFSSSAAQAAVYRLGHLTRAVRALGLSESSKVQMNAQGMLSLMCRMREGGGGERCFVEFLVVAVEIEAEDDDGDE